MDNTFIIDNLLRQNESEVLEFKVKLSEDLIAKHVTSMLNNRGGDIIIGIGDNKQIVGIENTVDVSKLLTKLMSEITPAAPVDVQEIAYNGKNLLLIRVWEGSQKPYSYKGTIYQKIGSLGRSISKIISDRKDADLNWERMPALGADLSDLDMDEVRKTIDMYQASGAKESTDAEEFLINNGLIQNGSVTNACVLLYAKSPSRFFAQSGIKLSVFSSDSLSDLVDSRNYTWNIFKNAEAIFQFIDICYSKTLKIDGLLRTEKWNYPRVAVREGIMNAIVHRDYSNHKGFLHINVYPNHLDVLNYGALEPIVTFARTGIVEYSMLRNPDIAYQCYYRQLIEMRGTGIPRMKEDCTRNNFAIPVISVEGEVVKVSFPQLILQRKNNSGNHFEQLLDNSFGTLNEKVRQKMLAVLTEVASQPGIKAKAIEDATGLPKKSIDRYLAELKNAGIICYKGSRKSGGFYVETKE